MRPILIILLLLSTKVLFAQEVDSLLKELEKTTSEEVEILILRELGDQLQVREPYDAISYYRRAERLSEQLGDSLNRALSFNSIAVSYYYLNQFDSSLYFYFRALNSTTDEKEFYKIRSRLYNNIGWDYQKRGLHGRAIDYFKESIRYSTLIGDITFEAFVINNLGVAFKNKADYDSAEFYLRRSLVMNREMGNRRFELFNINNLGVVNLRLGNTEMAREYLVQALQANYERRDSSELLNNLINIAELLLMEENYMEAIDTLDKALPLALQLNSDVGRMNIYGNAANVYEQMGDYEESLRYHKWTEQLEDSLFRNEIANYELDFQMREQVLRREKETQAQRLYSTIITLSLISAFVIIFILIRFYLSKQKSEVQLLKLNAEIQEQAKKLLVANNEVREINQNLEAMVEVRTREIAERIGKMNEYAFVNAHKLRGPLASLLGLIELLNEESSLDERQKLIGLIKQSAEDVDRVVEEIAMLLALEED